jgi:hypothetical protein
VKRIIKEIFIHCSGLPYGTYVGIDQYHETRRDSRGNCWTGVWDEKRGKQIYCGYHYVIEGAYTEKHNFTLKQPNPLRDGRVVTGRPENKIGAHVRGRNSQSIGICYIGLSISVYQLLALQSLLLRLLNDYNHLRVDNILGHYEVYGNADETNKLLKTCPNMRMDVFRSYLQDVLKWK